MDLEQHENGIDSSDVVVVCDKTKVEDLLKIIAVKGVEKSELRLQYTNNYEPIVQVLLHYLRCSFGWVEVDRERKKVITRKGHEILVWVVYIEQHGSIRGI